MVGVWHLLSLDRLPDEPSECEDDQVRPILSART